MPEASAIVAHVQVTIPAATITDTSDDAAWSEDNPTLGQCAVTAYVMREHFGGEILVVGLGCEKLAPERLVPEGVSDAIVRMQDEAFDGFGAIVDAIMTQAEARLKVLNARKRETCPAADLVIGLQCGGSDAFSGVTANPAVGYCTDLLVRAGASVIVSIAGATMGEYADLARRLMELGFVPGEKIRMLKRGMPGGEPLAIKVGNSTFALRRFEAALVSIQPE